MQTLVDIIIPIAARVVRREDITNGVLKRAPRALLGRLQWAMDARDQVWVFRSQWMIVSINMRCYVIYCEYDSHGERHGYYFRSLLSRKKGYSVKLAKCVVRAHWRNGKIIRYVYPNDAVYSSVGKHYRLFIDRRDKVSKLYLHETPERYKAIMQYQTIDMGYTIKRDEDVISERIWDHNDGGITLVHTSKISDTPASVWKFNTTTQRRRRMIDGLMPEAIPLLEEDITHGICANLAHKYMVGNEPMTLVNLTLPVVGRMLTRDMLARVPRDLMWRLQCATPPMRQGCVFGSATWIEVQDGELIRIWQQKCPKTGLSDGVRVVWMVSEETPELNERCPRAIPDGYDTDPFYTITSFGPKIHRSYHSREHGCGYREDVTPGRRTISHLNARGLCGTRIVKYRYVLVLSTYKNNRQNGPSISYDRTGRMNTRTVYRDGVMAAETRHYIWSDFGLNCIHVSNDGMYDLVPRASSEHQN